MKEKLDPRKFRKALGEICMEAEQATIDLLKANGKKCFVVDPDVWEVAYGEDNLKIKFCAVGIDEEDNLMIGGIETYNCDYYDMDNVEADFEPGFQSTEYLLASSLPDIYEFVASKIEEYAVTLEEAESILSNKKEEYDDDEDE